jgi:hypothetical protein
MVLLATPALAVELHHIEVRKGTDGLTPAPLTIANEAAQPISCIAALAHWYSATLAEIAPGAKADIALWFDPQSGTITVLNDKQENMPIEALYCGLAGRAYATRAPIAFERLAGNAPGARSVACVEREDRLQCSP